jgi:hypothetical protein
MHLNSIKIYGILLCFLAGPLLLHAKDAKLSKGEMQKMVGKKPLLFLENKGQIVNEHFKSRKDIQYEVFGNGMNIFVGKGQLHYQFNKFKRNGKKEGLEAYRVDMHLAGCNPNAQVIAEDQQEYRESYRYKYISNNQVTAHSFRKVTYRNIYPNIDWVLYINNERLEYDFVVRPGGNAKNIRLCYNGATSIVANLQGDVKIISPKGDITEGKPYAYVKETGKEIASSFELKKNTLSFNISPSNGTIVIDPKLAWLNYYGGNGSDAANSAVADASGNVYLVGSTSSLSSISTTGVYQTVFGNGTADCFIAKYNSSGNLVWGTYFGASGTDVANDVAIKDTFLYITGYSSSVTSSGFATSNAYDTTYHGGTSGFGATGDAFLAKFTTNDSIVWCTYYGGPNSDGGYGVTVDNSGYIYFTGATQSRTVMATSDGYDTSYGGKNDIFLAKFDGSCNRIWATYYGDTGSEQAYHVRLDNAGNPYIIGTSSSPGLASSGAHQTTFSTGTFATSAALLVKFDGSSGARRWATYYGNGGTSGYSIGIDTLNGVYILGGTTSSGNIASTGAWQTSFGGGFGSDVYIAKFDTSGTRQWGTYYGGSGTDATTGGVGFDAWNNLVFTGNTSTNSASTIIGLNTASSPQPTWNKGADILTTKFTPLGQLLWGSYWGGQRSDNGLALAYVPSSDILYVAGYTTSKDSFISTRVTSYDTTFGTNGGGNEDAFVMEFNADTFVVINQPYIDTLLCPGSTFNLGYTASHSFNSGNTFTAQMSNSAGSFASPTVIGSVTANSSGSIPVTIPLATATGTGYKIRVVASDPLFYSPDDFYSIHVVATVPTNPSASSNTPICVGDTLKLSVNVSAPGPITYTWTGPSGFSSSVKNPYRANATTGMSGIYKIVTSHDGCAADSTTTTVAVNNVYPNTPTDSTNAPVCAGTTLLLFSRSTTTGVTYSWTGPAGFTSDFQNPVISPVTATANGIYYVTANLNGCKAKDSIFAEVDIPSTPNITITADAGDTICEGTNGSFSSSILFGGSSPQYQWVLNSTNEVGAISSVWGTPYLNDKDTVYCILTSNAYCITSSVITSNKIVMTVLPILPPAVVIKASPGNVYTPGITITFTTTVFNGGTSPSFQWRLNGVNIPGATNSFYSSNTLNAGDKVSVEVMSNAMCVNPDTASSNVISVNVNGLSSSTNVQMYPNPNDGNFVLRGNIGDATNISATIEILNLMGEVIYRTNSELQNGNIEKQVNLDNNIPNGMYILRLRSGDATDMQRFTIRR